MYQVCTVLNFNISGKRVRGTKPSISETQASVREYIRRVTSDALNVFIQVHQITADRTRLV